MRDEFSASEKNPDKNPDRSVDPAAGDPSMAAREGKAGRNFKDSPHAALQPEAGANKDITHVLKGWDYESGTINVRKVTGMDGLPKLQMRLDLGLLQMEMTGRPDGTRPHGYDSLLDFYETQLKDHETQNGTDLGFHINAEQCQSLRDESVMYYHRYLSLFVLGEFGDVVRDTARNLRVLDFCGSYALEEQDRLVLEEFRPYILMMNTRAAAFIQFKEKDYKNALVTLHGGMKKIKQFFARFGQEEAYNRCSEVKVLRKFAKDVRRKLPVDPVRRLQQKLDRAVREERYEDAARLRDELGALTASPSPTPGREA